MDSNEEQNVSSSGDGTVLRDQEAIPKGARSSREALQALQQVYIETEASYNQSNAFAERIYNVGSVSLARRNVLLHLLQSGPQTVPQLARRRSVSRQYMQRLVHQLLEEGHVQLLANTANKRSQMVQLTASGKAYMTDMLHREAQIVAAMNITIPVEMLNAVAEGLRVIRVWQKSEMERLLPEDSHGYGFSPREQTRQTNV